MGVLARSLWPLAPDFVQGENVLLLVTEVLDFLPFFLIPDRGLCQFCSIAAGGSLPM